MKGELKIIASVKNEPLFSIAMFAKESSNRNRH